MATIYNSDLTKELVAGAKIQQSKELPPTQLAEKVVPVMEVNPKLLRVCNIVRSTQGIAPTNVYTVPTNKDFYLVSAWVAVTNIDNAGERVMTVTIDNQAQILLQIEHEAAGAAAAASVASALSINPAFPIKLDRGSNIVISGSHAKGTAGIIGFTVED